MATTIHIVAEDMRPAGAPLALCGLSLQKAHLHEFTLWVFKTSNWIQPGPTCETCILLNWLDPDKKYVYT